jgi:DNA replication protein DnaC
MARPDAPDVLARWRSGSVAKLGAGKTHLCVGLGIRAVEQGFSVQYFRFDELMTALKIDASLPPARLKRRKYMSTALLLIDELGFEPMTRPEASLFFRLVTYGYGRGAILITTRADHIHEKTGILLILFTLVLVCFG